MIEFINTALSSSLLQTALLGAILACVACGIVGSYVVVRRITYMAGAIAHCVLAGVGGAYYLQKVHGLTWCDPFFGAFASAILAAGIIAWVSLKAKQREDTVIGALWATGMAIGVLFIKATPGSNQELMSRLFGNILLIGTSDLTSLVILDLIVIVIGVGFYKQLFAICFDEEFAKTRGINVEAYFVTLLMLTAITVVLLASVVGIIMVIALLTLPVAIGNIFFKKLWQVMIAAILLSTVFTVGGFAVGYDLDFPPGATTIVLTGIIYLAISAGRAIFKSKKIPKSK